MTFKRLLNYLKPYKKRLIIISLITILSSLISIFTPKILADIITILYDSTKNNEIINKKVLYLTITTLSILYITNIITNYLENNLTGSLSQNILHTIKNETNQKLSKLSVSYYDKHSKGEILSNFNNDIEALTTLYSQVIPKTINYIITFLGTLIMMFYIDSILTLITLIALPLTAFISKILLKFSKKKKTQYYQKIGYLNSLINECYLNKDLISIYNNDKLMIENFEKLNNDLAKTNIKYSLITGLLSPISSLINYLIYLLILILGAKHVLDGKLKFGQIQSLMQYTKQLANPLNNSSSLLSQIQNSIIASKRIFKILDEEEETNPGKEEMTKIKTIEFKNVDFSYDNSPLIQNFNLKINEGEKIAIVGETGSGKSTIINLLMRFYKINNGNILINNKSLYEYNLKNYYKEISLVPQDLQLLNDTLKNNLKYGDLEANEEKILNTCKATNCLEIINKMPNKLEEIINHTNQNISEGEKQLFTITRSLIKEHSLLILDEATSNIDSKTENLIEDTIKNISKNKITIIIAHRLSTITNADKIIVMKNGTIVEHGNHTSLYKEKGEYYKFIQAL